MGEVVAIVAGVGSILKVLTSTGIYLQGIGSASREAQEVANQVHATEAILRSLKASLRTVHRSQEFYDVWGESTKMVLQNVKVTTEELNKRLATQSGKAKLSFWSKAKWPLARDEGLKLQQHLQAYMQMLIMVQNAFMQGNMQTVRESAKSIDDIFTQVGTLPSSTTLHSEGSKSNWSRTTISPEDSVSQVGVEELEVEESSSQQHRGRSWRGQPNTFANQDANDYTESRPPRISRYLIEKPLEATYGPMQLVRFEIHSIDPTVYTQTLSVGKVRLWLSDDLKLIHLEFVNHGTREKACFNISIPTDHLESKIQFPAASSRRGQLTVGPRLSWRSGSRADVEFLQLDFQNTMEVDHFINWGNELANTARKQMLNSPNLNMTADETTLVKQMTVGPGSHTEHSTVEDLGAGAVTLALSHGSSQVWLIFKPTGFELYESRWIVYKPPPRGSDRITLLGTENDKNPSLVICDAVPDTKSATESREDVTLLFNDEVNYHLAVGSFLPKRRFLDVWSKYTQATHDHLARVERERILKARASRMVSRT